MENKDTPPRREGARGGLDGESENKPSILLKQKINSFLIYYFSYFALAIAVLIIAGGLFFFIYPQYQAIAKNNEIAKKNLQSDYDAKNSYLRVIRDLKKSYQQISAEDRKKIEAMVPVGNEITGLIPEIESITVRNGVVLNSIKIAMEDLKNQFKEKTTVGSGEKPDLPAGIFEQMPEGAGLVKIEINLSSINYQVLKNLLKTFENNLQLFDLAKISYDVQEHRAALIIYSYYLPR